MKTAFFCLCAFFFALGAYADELTTPSDTPPKEGKELPLFPPEKKIETLDSVKTDTEGRAGGASGPIEETGKPAKGKKKKKTAK